MEKVSQIPKEQDGRKSRRKAKLETVLCLIVKACYVPWTLCGTTEPHHEALLQAHGDSSTWEDKQTGDKQTDRCAPRTVPMELPGPLPLEGFSGPLGHQTADLHAVFLRVLPA